jgi:1,4-dihydroxy-2-naphthoyl-CoA synthase
LGDGVVLRGELRDGPPAFVLGGDGFVRGQLSADVLEP